MHPGHVASRTIILKIIHPDTPTTNNKSETHHSICHLSKQEEPIPSVVLSNYQPMLLIAMGWDRLIGKHCILYLGPVQSDPIISNYVSFVLPARVHEKEPAKTK